MGIFLSIVSAISALAVIYIGVRADLLPPDKRWRKERWITAVGLVAGVGFIANVWLSIRADRAEAVRDAVLATVQKTLEPAKLAVEVHPIVVERHVQTQPGSVIAPYTDYGLSVIVHATNTGGLPGFIKLLRLDGELPLTGNEFIAATPSDGLTLQQVDQRYGQVKPFRVLAWRVPPFIDEAKVEHGADRYFLFDVIMPTMGEVVAVGTDPATVLSDYMGSSTAGTQPKTRTTSPNIFHVLRFARAKDGRLESLGWRDEVTSGALKFSLETDGGPVSVPLSALQKPTTSTEAELHSRSMRDLFEGVDPYRVMPPR